MTIQQAAEKRIILLMVRKMLVMDEPVEKVAVVAGLSVEELQQLTQQYEFVTN